MSVNTLGEAWKLGWRLKAHCYIIGRKAKTVDRTTVWCDTTTELDLKTLVWTRGEQFPTGPTCEPAEVSAVWVAPSARIQRANCKPRGGMTRRPTEAA